MRRLLLLLLCFSALSLGAERTIVLANSIDYGLAIEFIASLAADGLNPLRITVDEFEAYKGNKNIIILGGPDAPEGVGDIVQEVLDDQEMAFLREVSGNRDAFQTENVWADCQRAWILAGNDRYDTQKVAMEKGDIELKSCEPIPTYVPSPPSGGGGGGGSPAPATPTCTDGCSGGKQCSGGISQQCRDCDGDSCNEWCTVEDCGLLSEWVNSTPEPCCIDSTAAMCSRQIYYDYSCLGGECVYNITTNRTFAQDHTPCQWSCVDGACTSTPTCPDGTPYTQCSSTKPRYCSDGTMINRSSVCGCPEGYSVSGENCVLVPLTCSDGTLYGQCSPTKPRYCSAGTLIDRASTCGCLGGYSQLGEQCTSGTCVSDTIGQITSAKPCTCGGTVCTSDYCLNGRTCSDTVGGHSEASLLVVLLTDINTCAVGDECTSGTCCTLKHGSTGGGATVAQFQDNSNMKAVPPSEAGSYGVSECLHLTLSQAEIDDITAEVASFVSTVSSHSSGALLLDVSYLEVTGSIPMTGVWCGRYPAPWDINGLVDEHVTADVDFIITVHDAYDEERDIFLGPGMGGGTLGADWGINGAGHSFVLKNYAPMGDYMMHEWLHQLDYALETVTAVPDIYPNDRSDYPACGQASSEAHDWFPSADDCQCDPDFDYACLDTAPVCSASCSQRSGEDSDTAISKWNQHVLSAHYDPAVSLIGNHCRNGRQDSCETSVDIGGCGVSVCP